MQKNTDYADLEDAISEILERSHNEAGGATLHILPPESAGGRYSISADNSRNDSVYSIETGLAQSELRDASSGDLGDDVVPGIAIDIRERHQRLEDSLETIQ